MPAVLPSRSRPMRTFAAVTLFALVYVGVMVLIFAPKDMISAQSGAVYSAQD